MRSATQKDQLAKVLVLGDEHSLLLERKRKQRLIPGLRIDLDGREDVVTEIGQHAVQTAGCRADVEKEPQALGRTGSRS